MKKASMLLGSGVDRYRKHVKRAAGFLNTIAGWAVVAAMAVVVVNVVTRKLFIIPILGTYEYTGFLTSMAISFGIAYCAVENGHIMVGIFVEKMKERTQRIIAVITNSVALFFLALCTVRIVMYAGKLLGSGEVSTTSRTPFYIFVYMMAAGFCMLCLVLIMKIADAFWGSDD